MAICVMMKGRFPVDKRMNLLSLTWPIFIENMLFMLLGFIDIFVLSRYNDVAASAVSAANQVISICNLVFSIISGATAILISQSLGAEKRQSASMIAALSLLFSTLIGLIVSALIAVFHRPLLAALGAQGDILEYGCEYLLIVGGFIFTQAILNSVTAILRSHGYTRISMYVTAIMNVLNAILDTAFVLGLFGLPSLGVRGVAIATTLARVAGVAILCFMLFSQVGYGSRRRKREKVQGGHVLCSSRNRFQRFMAVIIFRAIHSEKCCCANRYLPALPRDLFWIYTENKAMQLIRSRGSIRVI